MEFYSKNIFCSSLWWCHNEPDGVSDHRRLHYLFNCLFRQRSKQTSVLRVTSLCESNPPLTSGFPSQRASNAYNVSIWYRHHVKQNVFKMSASCRSLCSGVHVLINHLLGFVYLMKLTNSHCTNARDLGRAAVLCDNISLVTTGKNHQH